MRNISKWINPFAKPQIQLISNSPRLKPWAMEMRFQPSFQPIEIVGFETHDYLRISLFGHS
jgi:hypothetical protein